MNLPITITAISSMVMILVTLLSLTIFLARTTSSSFIIGQHTEPHSTPVIELIRREVLMTIFIVLGSLLVYFSYMFSPVLWVIILIIASAPVYSKYIKGFFFVGVNKVIGAFYYLLLSISWLCYTVEIVRFFLQSR